MGDGSGCQCDPRSGLVKVNGSEYLRKLCMVVAACITERWYVTGSSSRDFLNNKFTRIELQTSKCCGPCEMF